MAINGGGKTRTTKAHGPTAAKKPYKATDTKKPFTPRSGAAPSTTSSAAKPFTPSSSTGTKRKAEDDKSFVAQPAEKPAVVASILNAPEEIDFPRGGGTNLTQVEVYEAQLEGEKEARDEEDELTLNTEVVKDKSKAKRRKLERALQGAIKEKNVLPKDAFRVEHLNYKRLIPGTKVLAQIILVRALELVVSLPNQLLAHIPITNISPEYTTRLEASGESSDEEEYEEESEAESSDEEGSGKKSSGLPGLATLFKEGDWVSAIVMASKSSDSKAKLGGREGDENVRASRRIELSLEPEKVNEGVAKGDLKAGFTLTGSVKSVEDHGYILSLGLPSLTSFLPFKEAKRLQPTRLEVGQLVACRIKDVSENGRTCNVTVGRAEVVGSSLSSAASISSILPSTLVTALVTAVLSSGLNVKFFGYFDGTIDLFHLNGLDPETDFKVGQKVKARVLWDSIGSTPKKFSLSLSKHVLEMGVAKVPGEEEELEKAFPVGRIIDQVKVVRMDDEWGLTCEVQEAGATVVAFVHISRITDDHLNTIPKSGPWKVGTVHRARVIGFSALDGLVQLSLQPTILEQSFLRVSDVKVGEIIKGTVKRLGDNALFVSISGNVDGVVWPMHYSDIRLKHPEKKFKAGANVKARIYSVDPVKNRVALTLKKQLIESEFPILASLADAKVGVITHGTVSKILDKAVLVDFFGGMRAIIPAGEAAEGYTANLSLLFSVGKVIPVRIINVDQATGKLVASARQAQASFAAPTDAFAEISIGNVLSGTVAALHDSNLVLSLVPSKVKALISYSTLARHRHTDVESLRADLVKGQTIEDLVVVSKNADKGLVIVGLVPSKAKKVDASASATEPQASHLNFESLAASQTIPGRICGKVPTGLLVQLSRSVRGRVERSEISDDYDQLQSPEVAMGAHVQCYVLSVDTEHRRVDLSLRPSRLQEGVVAKDPAVSTVEDVKPGQKIRGFVKNIANHGLFVSLSSEVTARVQIKELFDEYVKEWKPRFAIGQLVEGKITAVDKIQNQVELSLRKNAAVKAADFDISTLQKGQVVKGTIQKVETYGAFIRIDGAGLNGLCHKSKVTDDEGTAWTEFVRAGKQVKAVILDVNVETRKISLGLKKSLFPAGADEEESGDDDDDEEDEDELMEGDDDDENEDDEDDDDEIDVNGIEFDSGSDDDDVEMDDGEDEAPVASTSKLPALTKPVKAAPLAVSSGFNWRGEADEEEVPVAGESDSDSDEEEETVAAVEEPAKKRKADLSTLDDQTGDLDSQAPKSVADFERLLLGSPNSSYLWIQFIAFYVGLSQLDQARKTGRRALSAINFREEQEKLNVWVALLNLENSYGDESTLEELFKEAVQSNDAKTVYLRMADIYHRSNKFEAEEELFKKLVKKFGQSSKAWTLFGQFYLTQGRPNEARDLLPRSLKSLEKRKHVKTITQFALLEFKLGDAERGRTIFEGIMDSYPKRLDLWFVYVDQEIKQHNVTGVRGLFERMLAGRLSSKKGKSVFKKWLAFEKEQGDEAGVENVKEKAMAFVESLGEK